MKAKEIFEKRKGLVAEARKISDGMNARPEGQRNLTGEERVRWDAIWKEHDELKVREDEAAKLERAESDITDSEKQPAGDRSIGRGDADHNPTLRNNDGGTEREGEDHEKRAAERRTLFNDRNLNIAMRSWLGAFEDIGQDERSLKVCRSLGINPFCRTLHIPMLPDQRLADLRDTAQTNRPADKMRALNTVIGSQGGSLMSAETFIPRIEVALLAFGGMMEVAEVITTSTAGDLRFPSSNDTANEGSYIDELEEASEDTNPSFASTTWRAWKAKSGFISASYEVLRDPEVDVLRLLQAQIAERLARFMNRECTTGSTKTRGIMNVATLGVTAASATAFTPDEVIQLEHSVDPSYRAGSRYMLSDAALLHVKLKKNGVGDYIWKQSLAAGTPDTLNNYPYTINQHMAGVTSTQKTVLFGRLDKYKIRRVGGLRMRRLDERYAEFDKSAFIAYIEFDGNLLDAGTHPVKYLQQA